ncbi:MAG: helicase-related protein [Candidatus Ornithospirochaeta sp.]
MTQYRDLPVYRHRNEILEALQNNQVIVVESPTGSGKTTQIPLILNDAGYAEKGIIGITQPRRIAAMSVSEFIKKEVGDEGAFCGYTMRFYDTTDRTTRIKIMTDGILLQEVKADPLLSRYSVIMVDEAHERSLNIDFILGLLKEIKRERSDLKIIISSATINTSSFSRFFDGAPIISIDSHPFPVSVNYMPLVLDREHEDEYYREIHKIIKSVHEREDGGDCLVFLPGEAEIKACIQSLYGSEILNPALLDIYPLYGRLSKEEQERAFSPTTPGHTKVVVSTNIAETSLTIDGIRCVIDSGWCKVNYYNQKNFTSALIPSLISRASADQRKGRAGRTQSGECWRLYSEKNYTGRREFSEEEILHSDLAEVVLRMCELGIYNPTSFPFITPPQKNALESAIETLEYIGAVKSDLHLTHIGEMMILFPLIPRLSRVMVEAILNYPDALSSVSVAVAFLSTKTPFVMPPGEEIEARDVHHSLVDNPYGDFAAWLSLYGRYTALRGEKARESFCRSRFLDKQTMDEIVHIRTQLLEIVEKMGVPVTEGKSGIRDYLICLASGLRQYICHKQDKFSYRSIAASEILIHPGSSWFSNKPEYILAGEIVQTTRMYARSVSPLKAEWIEKIDSSLLKELKESGKKKTRKEKFDSPRTDASTVTLEPYRAGTNSRGKPIYVVPITDIDKVRTRSSVQIYLKVASSVSQKSIKTSRLDKELSVIPRKNSVLKDKPRGKIQPTDSQEKILGFMQYLLKPFRNGKNTFAFLMLREDEGRYSLVPNASLESAVRETMYSLSSLIEMVPKKERETRKKLNSILKAYERAVDMDEE